MTTTTTQNLQICRIKFPEIKLQTRDAHKLRGYFGNLFKQHSPILHNHYEDGKFRYKYPSIQYKVLHNTPTLIGINEGATLLPKLFLKINELDINGKKYDITSKNIAVQNEEAGHSEQLHEYTFTTLWMALNQQNYPRYLALETTKEKEAMLNAILVGHILSFFRNMGVELSASERLMVKTNLQEKSTKFKENKMMAFTGSFIVNAELPEEIGLGKAVSRGFGTIKRN
ncbi:CRISPR-associated endonuclease Cas6 [Mesonia aestuariivivens]|uniref:DNA repair protein n=1 Tax=Mesonia aestuariivivens TaxID=2796128 RepID=A0ABS6W1S2_9FLAO|nr:CRISPR-associated endonuclease Cas6 [Mesonia aestuariivivens]MBW2961108.1 DNA repair protein [Mesonia aestuariivivens]